MYQGNNRHRRIAQASREGQRLCWGSESCDASCFCFKPEAPAHQVMLGQCRAGRLRTCTTSHTLCTCSRVRPPERHSGPLDTVTVVNMYPTPGAQAEVVAEAVAAQRPPRPPTRRWSSATSTCCPPARAPATGSPAPLWSHPLRRLGPHSCRAPPPHAAMAHKRPRWRSPAHRRGKPPRGTSPCGGGRAYPTG